MYVLYQVFLVRFDILSHSIKKIQAECLTKVLARGCGVWSICIVFAILCGFLEKFSGFPQKTFCLFICFSAAFFQFPAFIFCRKKAGTPAPYSRLSGLFSKLCYAKRRGCDHAISYAIKNKMIGGFTVSARLICFT